MKKIQKIEPKLPTIEKRKRVCAYARVSIEKGRAKHSLSSQVSFYNDYISKNKEWEFVRVYADLGLSGTSTERKEFQQMLADAEKGTIDIILTKSISRFARNTVDLLNTVRYLRDIGVEVRFEKENISTFSGDGELMLSILASYAQEESRSISDNVKWGIRKNFQKGIGNSFVLYGYRWDGEKFNLVEEEAEVIRYCFQNFLDGKSAETTEKELREKGTKGLTGKLLSAASIRAILRQEKYTGNLLLQKTFINNHIDRKETKNNGELPMYWVEDTHPKIIELEDFEKVQEEIARRRQLGALANWAIKTSHFTSKIHCSCGRNYQRTQRNKKKKGTGKYVVWMCAGQKDANRKGCINPSIPEYILKDKCTEILGLDTFDGDIFLEEILDIYVLAPGLLEFVLKSGERKKVYWESTAKKDWWTDETRLKLAKQRSTPEFSRKIIRFNEFTSFIKCEKCGVNYRCQSSSYVDGSRNIRYHCSTPASECKNNSITLDTLKDLIKKDLVLEAYVKDKMVDSISYISIRDNVATLHHKDGTRAFYTFENKRKITKPSEETKKKQSEAMKIKWRERREKENNDHSSNET